MEPPKNSTIRKIAQTLENKAGKRSAAMNEGSVDEIGLY
jgi:hypothetical protein